MRANEHPPQFIAKARKLWDAGLTTSKIGRRLGVSKNAIVGDRAPQRWFRPADMRRFQIRFDLGWPRRGADRGGVE